MNLGYKFWGKYMLKLTTIIATLFLSFSVLSNLPCTSQKLKVNISIYSQDRYGVISIDNYENLPENIEFRILCPLKKCQSLINMKLFTPQSKSIKFQGNHSEWVSKKEILSIFQRSNGQRTKLGKMIFGPLKYDFLYQFNVQARLKSDNRQICSVTTSILETPTLAFLSFVKHEF